MIKIQARDFQFIKISLMYLIVGLFLSLLRPLSIRFSLTRSFTSENSLHLEIRATYGIMSRKQLPQNLHSSKDLFP